MNNADNIWNTYPLVSILLLSAFEMLVVASSWVITTGKKIRQPANLVLIANALAVASFTLFIYQFVGAASAEEQRWLVALLCVIGFPLFLTSITSLFLCWPFEIELPGGEVPTRGSIMFAAISSCISYAIAYGLMMFFAQSD